MFTWLKNLNTKFDDAVDGFFARAKELKEEHKRQKKKRSSAWLEEELSKIRAETDKMREEAMRTGKPVITATQKPTKVRSTSRSTSTSNGRGNKNRISINGKSFDVFGRNVQIQNDSVYVDGVAIECDLEGIVKIQWEGDLADLKSDYRVDVKGDVHGNATSKMGMKCGNVHGDANAKMSLYCGDVEGNATSKMSLECKAIKGDAKAGMTIRGV